MKRRGGRPRDVVGVVLYGASVLFLLAGLVLMVLRQRHALAAAFLLVGSLAGGAAGLRILLRAAAGR